MKLRKINVINKKPCCSGFVGRNYITSKG